MIRYTAIRIRRCAEGRHCPADPTVGGVAFQTCCCSREPAVSRPDVRTRLRLPPYSRALSKLPSNIDAMATRDGMSLAMAHRGSNTARSATHAHPKGHRVAPRIAPTC